MSERLTYRADTDDWAELERGEFCYRGTPSKWLFFWPLDSDTPLSAAIRPQKNGVGASWELSGSLEAPTLRPSVNAEGIWHGFLTDGVAKQ